MSSGGMMESFVARPPSLVPMLFSHPELDILEFEVRWALGGTDVNKVSGYDGFPVCVLVARSCLTLCDPMGPGAHQAPLWNSLSKNTGVGCCSLLQGIFQTQGSNLGLYCRQILYRLSHQGSPVEFQ